MKYAFLGKPRKPRIKFSFGLHQIAALGKGFTLLSDQINVDLNILFPQVKLNVN